jgi:hypothetical protein
MDDSLNQINKYYYNLKQINTFISIHSSFLTLKALFILSQF